MKHLFESARHAFEYAVVFLFYHILRLLPYRLVKFNSFFLGRLLFLVPSQRKLILANLKAAMPELEKTEAIRIGRTSTCHMIFTLMEFFWLNGSPKRIERCYDLSPEVAACLRGVADSGARIIFVNPHLGSWEASGVMAPYYAGIRMAAIAKPLRNHHLNNMLNSGARERVAGLKIIFTRGAMKASIQALTEGLSIGTLIDQNTRVRDGGIFINFFGLPVSSSRAPATLARYCEAHRIPARIVYGTCVRQADGRVHAHMEFLSKPIGGYRDDEELIQEIMNISEKYIRKYPEQYLWLYKRFTYIPPDCPEEIRRRFPFYARVPDAKFFNLRHTKEAGLESR